MLFDVNETLSDMTPLRARFEEVGAPAALADTWFAGVLRDGFALTAAGGYADFFRLARDGLEGLLASLPDRQGDAGAAADHVLEGFAELPVHPDVPEGVRALRAAGLGLATMTNGSAANTERLLARAGLLDCFDLLLDVGGPRRWKPAPAAYRYAVDRLGAVPERVVLVAVHPWDVDGARRAGLAAAWVRRGSRGYPAAMTEPTHTVDDLRSLAQALAP